MFASYFDLNFVVAEIALEKVNVGQITNDVGFRNRTFKNDYAVLLPLRQLFADCVEKPLGIFAEF